MSPNRSTTSWPDDGIILYDGVRLVSHLPGWGWVRLLQIKRRVLRDAVYRLIARTRYRVWGRHAVCDLGDASYASRVITALPQRTGRH